ncbi:MAG TPA: hypothetical protein VEV15_01275 [Flavisolibacter sp.]|nr:hypothetical protein [Flavisolibacter sp.]
MRKFLFLFVLSISSYFALAQDSTLTEYKGIYTFKEGSPAPSVEISIRDGALYASSTIGSASLSRISKDTFSIPDHNGVAYFYRTEGKVKSIRIEVADLILEGDKDSASIAITRRKRTYVLSK